MNPFDRRLWASAWYLLAYLGVGLVLFFVAFAAATTAAALAVTLAGLPLLVAAAGAIRGCANAERARTGAFLGEPIGAGYREVTEPGIMAQVRTRWKDPATWRDVAYLVGMFVPLLALDTVVLAVWLSVLGGIALPIWWRFPEQTFGHGQVAHGAQIGYFPNGPHGSPGYGFYIDSLPRALIAAAVCLVLFLVFSRVLVLTARAHATVARALLRPASDPLANAREVLSRPGPLTSLRPNGQVLHVPAREGPAHGREPGNDHAHSPTERGNKCDSRRVQYCPKPLTRENRRWWSASPDGRPGTRRPPSSAGSCWSPSSSPVVRRSARRTCRPTTRASRGKPNAC